MSLHDGVVLVLGGMGGSGQPLADVWSSSDQGVSWSRVTDTAPWVARTGHRTAALPKVGPAAALLVGGAGPAGSLNDVWRTDDGGARWELATRSVPWTARSWFGLAALPSGSVLLFGGLAADGASLLCDVWRSRSGGRVWEFISDAAPWAARRGFGTAVLPSGAVLVLGGLGEKGPLSDIWCSSDEGHSWEQVTSSAAWPPRVDLGVAVLPGGAVLVLGGQDRSTGGCRNDVWRSDVGESEANPTTASSRSEGSCSSSRADPLPGTTSLGRLTPTQPPLPPECPSSPPAAALGRVRGLEAPPSAPVGARLPVPASGLQPSTSNKQHPASNPGPPHNGGSPATSVRSRLYSLGPALLAFAGRLRRSN